MRKWIVITLVAVVATGICTYVLLQPRRGSVEYHKREFLKGAEKRVSAVENFINRSPTVVRNAYWRQQRKRIEFHRQALFDAGYLTNRTFFVSNYAPSYVAGMVSDVLFRGPRGTEIMMLSTWGGNGRNKLDITAPAEVMDKIGELVRQIDAAESGK